MTRNALIQCHQYLENEAYSLLNRLNQVQSFSLSMPMVAAASVSDNALRAVTDHLFLNKDILKKDIESYIHFLRDLASKNHEVRLLQARFVNLKMRFNAILDQFDIFADVISQRSEHKTGVWIAGLDVLAEDALDLKGGFYHVPPVMCFLERGHGAAIRRARTRLPGGDLSPVAIIQVPRERMVGSGIASSLIHETGHQGAALLNLVKTIRAEMQAFPIPPQYQEAWTLLNLWLSEIIADFWAMAHLGIGATMGLMSVVSLPRYFMFRIRGDDPHPFPWIRVMISLAFGKTIFPDPQWQHWESLWGKLFPIDKTNDKTYQMLMNIEKCLPDFVQIVINHQNTLTRGLPLFDIFPIYERQPNTLRYLFETWKLNEQVLDSSFFFKFREPPSLIFSVIGQARADGKIDTAFESRFLSKALTNWALMQAEDRLIGSKSPSLSIGSFPQMAFNY